MSDEFFFLQALGGFLAPLHSIFIGRITVNKLQENYFSTVSQRFPYLTGTAVIYLNAFIYTPILKKAGNTLL